MAMQGTSLVKVIKEVERNAQSRVGRFKQSIKSSSNQPWAEGLSPVTSKLTSYGGKVLYSQFCQRLNYRSMWDPERRIVYVWSKSHDDDILDCKRTSLKMRTHGMSASKETDVADNTLLSSEALFLDLFIPQFKRVWEVSVTNDGYLVCSCGYANRNLISCRHQLHVLEFYEKRVPTSEDVHRRWHKAFQRHAYESSGHQRQPKPIHHVGGR